MSRNDQRNTIQLLINEEGNRAAVRELLTDYYEVETDSSLVEADLYLVDDYSFHDYHSALREHVDESDPVFCPVVLVRRDDDPHRVPLPNPDERDPPLLVDDIVEAPIDRTLLFRRLNTLLVRRSQSQELMHYISKLEESNRSLEQFAYAASHDLQEPLRMVSSYLQLIDQRYEDEIDEEGQEFLSYAIDGANRMRDMIEGLLEYSRVDTRGSPLEPTDLGAVLDEALADLRMKISEHDAEIEAEPLPTVLGDDDQLRQVFQNLLNNAIEYSGDEPPRIWVSARREGRQWRIDVSDDGAGIDPEDQDRIFELFQRLHSHKEHAGSGIGLALCKRIVERHDGRIWVDSGSSSGATFSFTLPALDTQQD
ncbi:histidine kinase [Natronococcus amylolyticus DSM 10524]|uniref:histidine kinase n=1 Tax=Natronococcus amylolyticus DSM 10524 TaxID=1227497 RepID=L9X0P0_9EURY|nr:ATP-binding protein [Natronococcus amylolyticus]ELY55290.1 histidine kinase [Natronococcus amylolyticus DSM 10524]